MKHFRIEWMKMFGKFAIVFGGLIGCVEVLVWIGDNYGIVGVGSIIFGVIVLVAVTVLTKIKVESDKTSMTMKYVNNGSGYCPNPNPNKDRSQRISKRVKDALFRRQMDGGEE